MRPITHSTRAHHATRPPPQLSKLDKLRNWLQNNWKMQDSLLQIQTTISTRISQLSQFIDSHRLKTEFAEEISAKDALMRYQHINPLKKSNAIEEQEAIRQNNQKDCDFITKLSKEPQRKKRIVDVADLPSNPKLINFSQIALSSNVRKTGLEIYRLWYERNKQKPRKRQFQKEQERRIVQKQQIYGDNWQKICQFIEGRTFQQVYYEFHNRLNPRLQPGRWTLQQSLILIILCEHYGTKKWALISQKMAVKSQLQVRERFCNILDPALGKNTWTTELQQKLLEIAGDYNYSWKDIAKLPIFKNKTDNCVWRKYRNLMVSKAQSQIQAMIPDKKGLLQKILKFKHSVDSKRKPPRKSTASDRTKHEETNTLRQMKKIEEEDRDHSSLSYIRYNSKAK